MTKDQLAEELGDYTPTILEQLREEPDSWDSYVENILRENGEVYDDSEND